jgi:tellurite resistance protein TehA-like permease
MMLILGSAPLLAASIYMTLGRYIRALDAEHHAIIHTRWLTKIYVAIDVISFVCQIMGSAAQASGDSDGMQKGIHLVLGGLAFQLVAFVCFIAMSAIFQVRLNNSPSEISARFSVNWKKYMWALYCVSVLVFIRSLYRFVEFAAGAGTIMVTGEECLYVFDASLLFLVAVCLALVHPGSLIKSVGVKQAERLTGDAESYIPLNGRES